MAHVKISKYEMNLEISPPKKMLRGLCSLKIRNTGKSPIKNVTFLLNKGLKVLSVSIQDRETSFSQNLTSFSDIKALKINHIHVNLGSPLLPNAELKLKVLYEGKIEPYDDVFNYVRDSISEEYSLVRLDAFSYPVIGVPDFSKLVHIILSQTFEYELNISVPAPYVVANIGELIDKEFRDGMITYRYRSKLPSWRIDIAVTYFDVIHDEEREIRIFTLKEDAKHATRLLHETKRVLDFYTKNFGEPVNWCGYTIIEIPAGWGSQADVCGILLNRESFVNEEEVGGLYHEIAHLWNVKTREKIPSRFLDEAFACYFQLLAEKEFLGKDLGEMLERARRRIIEMCQKAPILTNIPIIKYGEYRITDATYYIGPWVLHLLNKIAGEECFRRIIRNFLRKYKEQGATVEDFISTSIETCGEHLKTFLNDWLLKTKGIKLLIKGISKSGLLDLYIKCNKNK